MKVTWLTQAGLLFENDKIKILVDPYLSDSIGEVEPKKKRRMPIDERYFDLVPDVILITHDHRDHLDTATLDHYLKGDGSITVMSGENAFKKLLAEIHTSFADVYPAGAVDKSSCIEFFLSAEGTDFCVVIHWH